ncbi:MAG: hypothetical protein HYV35_06080, partial [Lentisphaerae bacterium]|nr:hypothetical protein [Lentisphaerota bacterium]
MWQLTEPGAGQAGPTPPTAFNSLQGAINAATPGVTVWVSNGVYQAGGVKGYPTGTVLTNRVAIWKAITVRSVENDPTNTIIKGAGPNGPAAVRCVYMTNGSALIGFTLTNGATWTGSTADETYGGGAHCQSTNTVISNCILTVNSSGWAGGGAYRGTLFN